MRNPITHASKRAGRRLRSLEQDRATDERYERVKRADERARQRRENLIAPDNLRDPQRRAISK